METLRSRIQRIIYVRGTASIYEIKTLLDKRYYGIRAVMVRAILDGLISDGEVRKNADQTYSSTCIY